MINPTKDALSLTNRNFRGGSYYGAVSRTKPTSWKMRTTIRRIVITQQRVGFRIVRSRDE